MLLEELDKVLTLSACADSLKQSSDVLGNIISNNLNIADNKLTAKGAKALTTLPNLIFLDVSYNYLGDKGMDTITDAGKKFWAFLDVTDNYINDAGAITLANGPTIISILFAPYNHIGSNGRYALEHSRSIWGLNLDFNDATLDEI